MPDKTINDLAENIRQMKNEIRDLKGQLGISQVGNQTIYQTLSEQIINKPTIRDPQVEGTTTDNSDVTWAGSASFTNSVNVDGGDLVVHTAGEIQVPVVKILNPDAGVDQIVLVNVFIHVITVLYFVPKM